MKLKSHIALFIIVLSAVLIRFYHVADVPPGLNRDEAAIGYTAYSILKTGRDEHGVFLPLSLKSFGDWKLPGYIYAAIPSVAVLGLSETSVRMPSVVFGVSTVLLSYLIAQQLFNNKSISLVSALLLAFSPWHLFFSRVTSEANMAVFLTSLGFYFILLGRKKQELFIPGMFFLAMPLMTYHGNHVFTPLLFIGIIAIIRKQLVSKTGFVAVGIFLIIAAYTYSHTLSGADTTKLSGLFIGNDVSLVHENIDQNRVIFQNPFWGKLFNNKAIFLTEKIAHNYVRAFSPEFLFIQGGANEQHNIPDFGNVYLIEAPFILLGLYFLFAKKEKASRLLLWWLLIAPLGASLTKDAPHSARTFAIYPALTFCAAFGAVSIVNQLRYIRCRQMIIVVLAGLYVFSVSLFFSRYFVTFPYKRFDSWGNAYQEMSAKLAVAKNNYDAVTISKPELSPYIYYLFYERIDPRRAQSEIRRFTPTDEGFEHVSFFDGIQSQKINWTDELLIPNRLYIDWADGMPSGATNSAVVITPQDITMLSQQNSLPDELQVGDVVTSRLIDEIQLPNASPFMYFIETRIGTPSSARR